MASSNRHWPSMFKSKPCNSPHHHQWPHHDINSSLISPACHRSPYSSGCEERSPEPKPRWNPKPEQIRILEAIFNSGMVNPPRDEIRKIRGQLQEFGQVGDANVFYWFQNRKSRSKHKQRNLQNAAAAAAKSQNYQQPPPISATSSSSTSSDKSSPKSIDKAFSLLNSPTASVNQQPYFGEFLQEPSSFFQPTSHHVGSSTTTTTTNGGGGFCFPELGNVVHGNNDQTIGTSSLLTDLMMMNHGGVNAVSKNFNKAADQEKMKLQQHQLSNYNPPPSTSLLSILPPTTSTVTVSSSIHQVQGASVGGMGENGGGGLGSGRSTVFINDMPIDVGVGPIDVREAIGDDYVLINSTGQPVLTSEWGVTLQPLQHGASYYVVPRSFNPSPLSTIDLM